MFKLAGIFVGIAASKLVINSPEKLASLFKQEGALRGVIEASYANFGLIPYGHSMVSTKSSLSFILVKGWQTLL